MVFHSISEAGTRIRTSASTSKPLMASSTLKSHPLHNFPLPDLKWGINHPNNHRVRRLADSARKSPQHNADSESDNLVGESAKLGAASSDRRLADSDGRSKIFIRIPVQSKKCADEVVVAADQHSIAQETDELMPKTWNLRPRRPINKATNACGAAVNIARAVAQETRSQRQESTRTRNGTEAKVAEKKQKFSVSLSRVEIEDDIFAMTGSKPSRRPKKRVKNVQKQLDCMFPGLWLAWVTPDSYQVSDAPLK